MIAFCKIDGRGGELNGKRVDFPFVEGVDWKKSLYSHLGLDYPRFFRMDDLSKLTILCMELIKQSSSIREFEKAEISMIFSNKSASTFTDNLFVETLEKGRPSPSLFVYTLPNVCVGELTIKNLLYGGSSFYISNTIIELPLRDLVEIELNKGYKNVLIGRVDKSNNTDFGLFFLFDSPVTNEDLILIGSFNK